MLKDWARLRRGRQPPLALMAQVAVDPALLNGLTPPQRRVTARELERAEQSHRQALQAAERTRRARDELVRQAVEQRWTLTDIARATGLPRGRLDRIIGS